MTIKTARAPRKVSKGSEDVETLYLELLHWFYDKEDRRKAKKVAPRLEAALEANPDVGVSILGEEIRSLLAELRGDLDEAIRYRECEIRKIRRLHSLAINKPGWDYVQSRYGFSDLSDRLDLLAHLHAKQGNYKRAIEILHESRQYCEAHAVPFDGQDLLDDYEKVLRKEKMRDSRRRARAI